MASQPSLRITLVKSPIGQKQRQKDTVRALGLRKMHQTVVRPDNPQMRSKYEDQVVRTFYLSNADPTEVSQVVSQVSRLQSAVTRVRAFRP